MLDRNLSWDDVTWLKSISNLPLLLKVCQKVVVMGRCVWWGLYGCVCVRERELNTFGEGNRRIEIWLEI